MSVFPIGIKKLLLASLIAMATVLVATGNQGRADPRPLPWENWKTDFKRTNIDISTIISGGPPKDGIPAIDRPKFISVATAADLADRDPVIGIEINGDARAYPLGVLMRHEIANDVVGGKPVTVTYCPLCNSAIVFDAMIDGKHHDFGTTGRLRNSDLVMYDRQTESWWQQFSGKALIGHYVGKKLQAIPSRIESFANFKKRYPEGKVLAGETGSFVRYGINPYTGYDTASKPFLYKGEMPKGVDPMARVIVIRDEQEPLAVLMNTVRKKGKMTISGYDIAWTKGQASALDTTKISDGREVGNITVSRIIDTASKSDVKKGAKDKGSQRQDVIHEVTFAFVAHAFFPDIEIIK